MLIPIVNDSPIVEFIDDEDESKMPKPLKQTEQVETIEERILTDGEVFDNAHSANR